MKQILLTQGKVALVDDDIYEAIGQLKWYAHKIKGLWYAERHFKKTKDKYGILALHHCVVGFPLNYLEVDHIDGDGLNNQRSNLRVVTVRVNQHNQKRIRDGKVSSKYVGVRLNKGRGKKWIAQAQIKGKNVFLGRFDTEQEAYKTYLAAL